MYVEILVLDNILLALVFYFTPCQKRDFEFRVVRFFTRPVLLLTLVILFLQYLFIFDILSSIVSKACERILCHCHLFHNWTR